MFWLCGVDDERKPGADRFAERRAVAEVLATMPPNIPIMGFPFGGECIGPSEPEGVAFASRYAKGLICSDHLANACVTSGIRIAELPQRPQNPAPALARDKLYVALALSDGDNQNAWFNFFSRYFEHPSFGKFPLAFGIGPTIRELQPAVAQWFYERATPNTEFIADVSGVAYMEPEEWGRAYADRDRVFAGFLDWTARLMPPLGLRTVRPVDGRPETIARYARALPFCHSIFADMGCYAGYRGHAQLTYALPDGRPVVRAATTWRKHDGGFLGELREQAGAQRPAFLNGFVHCWTFGPDDLARIYAERDPDMVFVTPTQLAALYREAREKDWVK